MRSSFTSFCFFWQWNFICPGPKNNNQLKIFHGEKRVSGCGVKFLWRFSSSSALETIHHSWHGRLSGVILFSIASRRHGKSFPREIRDWISIRRRERRFLQRGIWRIKMGSKLSTRNCFGCSSNCFRQASGWRWDDSLISSNHRRPETPAK